MIRDALVVGINKYDDDKLSNLNAPANDAEAIATILEGFGEFNNLYRLPEATSRKTRKAYIDKNQKLTLTELENALVTLFKPEGEGRQILDTALFYFSGHGIRKNKGIQEGFLCTSDVDLDLGFNGLSLHWLRRLLQQSPIKQQIIWLDCCHSGILLNFNEAHPGEAGQARDRCFIAASREFEPSYEDLNSEYSVFTKVLLDGLNPHRSFQQWITNNDLTVFINKNFHFNNQTSIFANFGSPIHLTRTLDNQTLVIKGQENGDICPYKGLEYFDCNEEDPKYFYGREKLTDKLLDRVRKNNFLAILGASGSGKSSVLRAGLLHQLKLGEKLADSQNWEIKIMLPGKNPLQNLALAWLEDNLSDVERATQLNQCENLLKQGAEGLRKLVQASSANRVILVVDQFEEAFTLCQDLAEREVFFQCLLEALSKTENKLCLVLTMRIDFFGKCFERTYSGLGAKIQDKDNFIAITPMETKELKKAIIEPAKKVNLSLETGLVEDILKDLKISSGNLPLLQDTLTELWQRRTNNQLKLATYSQLGRIGGTLNQRAKAIYQKLTPVEQDTAQHIFLSLTQLGEGTEDTRRRILKQDLITAKHDEQLINEVVQKLADERLIVTRNQVEKNSDIGKQVEIDVAHEALIKNWILLRQWLDERRNLLRQQRKIEYAAQEWKLLGEKTDYLWSKNKLKEANNFHKQQKDKYSLSLLAASFIEESINYQRKEKIKFLLMFLIIPLIGTPIGGYFVVKEALLNADKSLIRECQEKKFCHGRIQALERLVKANRSLKSYNLQGANLQDANLQRANLQRANLIDVYLIDANLQRANLQRANLQRANLMGANLQRANLIDVYLQRANLQRANLIDVYLIDANLQRANFQDANLIGANLIGANLIGANLIDANLIGANLQRANLQRANLQRANLIGANLIGANLIDANLIDANFIDANFQDANLQDANLQDVYLIGANLQGSNLQRANLQDAYLQDAYLQDANLQDANLIGANLIGANLIGANLIGANLQDAYLQEIKNLTNRQIKEACNWEKAVFERRWDQEKRKWIINQEKQKAKINKLKEDKSSDPKKRPNCYKWEHIK